MSATEPVATPPRLSLPALFLKFLRFGCLAFGGPIAQGFLTLALLTTLGDELLRIDGAEARINYGLDRVRFIAPVKSGKRIRGRFRQHFAQLRILHVV